MTNKTPTDALRLVPVEPTPEMLDAVKPWPKHWPPYEKAEASAQIAYNIDRAVICSNWTHMLAAAPASPLPEGGDQLSKNLGQLKSSDLDALENRLRKAKDGQAYRSVRHRHHTFQVREDDIDASIALIAELRAGRAAVEELLYAQTDKSIAMGKAFLARNGKGEG